MGIFIDFITEFSPQSVCFEQKPQKNGISKDEKYQQRQAEKAAKAKIRRDQEPLLFIKLITKYPKAAFGKILLQCHFETFQ